ncbi:MAG: hypothetical protein Kow0098_14050 [Ignavibacteriaceae bacterium]
MRTGKKLMYIVLFSLFSFAGLLAQQDDPRKWNMQIEQSGEAIDIPQDYLNYVHPNTEPMVFETALGQVVVAPNFRIFPSVFTQSEVPITRHPTNPDILYASSNSVRISPFFISEGVYVSTDGGVTWFGSDTTKANPIGLHGGDPAPAIDGNGRFFQSYLSGSFNGLYASYSTDLGATWANAITLQSGSQDKNHTVVDNRPGSPYYGNVYVSWSRFTAFSPPIAVSRSTNGGVSWSAPQDVNVVAAGHYSQGVNGVIGPNGEVYMFYQNPVTFSPYTGDFMGMAKSTDGGVTWTYNNNIYDCNGIRGFLTNKASIRVNDFPWAGIDTTNGPYAGYIYVVHAEKNLAPAGSDPDIILHRSTDGGLTWSAGIRVNQDAVNNGKDQYMPALVVGSDGSVNVVYYDSRNTTSDSAEVYISRSTDGGLTWTDVLVSDHRFKPKPISGLAGGYQGDYIGITETDGIVWPYWCSDKSGIYQAWITSADFTGGSTNPNITTAIFLNPSSGNGIFDLTFEVTNNETTLQNVDIWLTVKLPNNNLREILNRNVNLNSGQVISRTRNFNISSRPVGQYTFTLNVGIYPSIIYNSATEIYTKTSIQAGKDIQSDDFGPITDVSVVAIEPNYPNPFNPTTNITYSIPDDRNVSLRIYNSLGEEVATLVNQYQKAGRYSAQWNGTNHSGDKVSSGIYIYRLVAGDFVQERKMILTK